MRSEPQAQLTEVQAKLTAILTDQRPNSLPRRSWWRWGQKLGVAVAVWVAACGPAWAEDGNELLETCLEALGPDYCRGYVTGVAEAVGFADAGVCLLEEVPIGQMSDVVVRYLQAHPETRHHPAVDLARAALVEVFPCQR